MVSVPPGITDNPNAFVRWMETLERSVEVDLRSAIYKDLTREQCASDFEHQVPMEGPRYTEHMVEREHKEFERFLTPWSIRPSWRSWGPKTVVSYYERRYPRLSTLGRDMELFRKRFLTKPLEAYPFRKSWDRLPATKSSGLPWLVTPWKAKVGSEIYEHCKSIWSSDGRLSYPASMPMWRVDPPGKVRLAWAESKYEAVMGGPWIYPFIDWMRQYDQFVAWRGPEATGVKIGDLLRKDPSLPVLSIDYSSFDQTQTPELVTTVLNELVWPSMGSIKPGVWRDWVHNFTAGPLVTPDRLVHGEHGVPSGSVATNFVDSINNALCILGYMESYGIEGHFFVQGDDAIIIGQGVEPDTFSDFARTEYGFIAHPEKQHYGYGEADFLKMSYYAANSYLPTYPCARVGWRMIGHERYSFGGKEWGPWAVVVRAVQQLQNAIHSPAINDLVEWAAEGDSLRLGANESARKVLALSGGPGRSMTTDRARWDPGEVSALPFYMWPINLKIRELFSREE